MRTRGRAGSISTLKPSALGLRDVMEGAVDALAQRVEGDLLGLDGDRARLDLRQIEDVVDEGQQIGARRVDVLGEVDLLAGQVAADVLGQLLAEDEDRVERRAQLVRHVGEELGLVLGGERQLGGLLLERAPGLLDLLVLALDLLVLLGELLGLRGQLLVRLLELDLPRLQLGGQLLRLLQQVLGAHRRLDRVEDDADRLGQLVEERQVGVGERAQRGQLDDRHRLALEQHRQHDDALRRRRPQAGVDLRVVGRDVVEQDALLLRRRLADEADAGGDPLRLILPLRVPGQQLQHARPDGLADLARLVALHLVDGALLGVDERRQLGEQRLADGDEVALALQHAGELRQVGLQPVLLLVAIGRRRAGCRSSC